MRTRVSRSPEEPVNVVNGDTLKVANKLTEKEVTARKLRKYATTTFGYNSRTAFDAYGGGGTSQSSGGNFYSPQLSTDFLEKPQNLRERRAWYRHFYNGNEFVRRAVDLHTILPLSKIRLEKPKADNQDMADYVYEFFLELCEELKLTKLLMEISHEANLLGNMIAYVEDHEPYKAGSEEEEAKANEMKEWGRKESARLYEQFKITDKDPNYKGWRKVIILPPDQVRIKKVPMSDDVLVEFVPDPETRKAILRSQDPDSQAGMAEYGGSGGMAPTYGVPEGIAIALKDNGSIPMDTDPYSGSYVYHMANNKSQYETLGVSILECCINTLLLQDKLRQAQTSIASRHMTPIRIVWAEQLSEQDVNNLREQVDQAMSDPDFSIVANYQVNWEEMGSNGRLLDLSSEYEHIESALFAGLGVTREILTGEGTYSGSKLNLEIMNTQYLMFREMLQEFVENYLFKPIAKKKGFVEKDKFGREKLLYPKLSFTRLAVKDNSEYFDQMMQLYNKGSISIDQILESLNIDPVSTKKKIEADLFTVNDSAFNQFMINLYTSTANNMATQYNSTERIASYLNLNPLSPEQLAAAQGGGGMGGGMGGMPRFSTDKMSPVHIQALNKIVELAAQSPEKLDKIVKFFEKNKK